VEGGCPSCGVMSCGVMSFRVKDRPVCRLKDLPHGSVPLHLWVCKRRFVCREQLCSRGSFTEVSDQVPARSRLTTRLRRKVSAAVTATNRAMSEVAADYGVAWWTVHRILVATAIEVLGRAAPTSMIGIDETRAPSVRWFFKETGWARSDLWMTSIVDLDPSHPGGIIGLARAAPGRAWSPGFPYSQGVP
jgi:transposase